MTDLRNVPLADLQRFVDQVDTVLLQRTLRASQRAAWLQWRDDAKGMRMRFAARNMGGPYRFADRSPRSDRKGLPAYVHTGSFRRSLEKRKPKRSKDKSIIATSFSIFGGVLNMLGQANMRGFISSTISSTRQVVTRQAHTRIVHGAAVAVAAHPMALVTRKRIWTRASRTYRDEWEYRPWELAAVQQRSDALFLERFRRTALGNDGSLRPRWRRAHAEE